MDLVLVRHGETDWNRELRFQGQVDVPLNDIGHEQARRIARRLAGTQAAALYCSDLRRARDTALPIARQLSMAEVADAGLREQSFGLVDGMSIEEIQQRQPEAWESWLKFDPDYAMPQGESMREFHARVMKAVHRIALDHADGVVIVVTHGGVLDMVYRTAKALGLGGPRVSEIPNAGLNRVRVRGGSVEIVEWAEVGHLADMPPQPVYDQRKYAVPNPRAA
ncbi:MAG: histidine phosphatase family protein [Burkholderiales bacterium]|nr:histidine phosphatase family protein [Burkholderiales bacterium]